jgi:midasin
MTYSMTTTAPSALSASTIFCASSLGTPSFISLGALSTNFLLSTRLRLSRFLISLMTFGLDPASNDSSLRLNSVFSCLTGAASSSSSAAAGAAACAGAAKAASGASGMFSRV